MAAVAAHKGISIDHLASRVEGRTEFVGRQARTTFTSHVELGQGLTPREQRILFQSARLCEVHKMLQGDITFEDHLLG